jgi:hypothetical protein
MVPILRELITIGHLDHEDDLLQNTKNYYVYDNMQVRWRNLAGCKSAEIRDLFYKRDTIILTKTCQFENDTATRIYNKIRRISSIPLRTKALRFIHGDVYCGTRLVKFGLANYDTCIRCFSAETIIHLLIQCQFSINVWNTLGVNCASIEDILDPLVSEAEFEIRFAIIEMLVFRKIQMPPHKLVEVIFKRYANGLSKRKQLCVYAKNKLRIYEYIGQWL